MGKASRVSDRGLDKRFRNATERGGPRRLALSNENGEMRRQFAAWCESAGCEMRIDAVGNMVAGRAGSDPGAKTVLVGSHLDTHIEGAASMACLAS